MLPSATYVSYEKQIRQVCIFSLSNGILTSRVLVEELNGIYLFVIM